MNGEQFPGSGANQYAMQCPRCGGLNSPGSNFCGYCGTPFAPPQPPPPPYPNYNQPYQGYYNQQNYPPHYMAPPVRDYTAYTIWSAVNVLLGSWIFSIIAFAQISAAKKSYDDNVARRHIRNVIILNIISNILGMLAVIFVFSLS